MTLLKAVWAPTQTIPKFRMPPLDTDNYRADRINNDPITPQKHVRDLGVHMSTDLTFNYYINNVVKKGINIAHWILRIFRTRATMKILLKTPGASP